MTNRLELRADLDALVARRFLAPQVQRLAGQVRDQARANAPGAKSWITMRDERVRASHRDANSQTVPANLRYVLDHPDGEGTEMARVPRDPDLSLGNREGCRCASVPLADEIRRRIHHSGVTVAGTQVRAEVAGVYHRIVESEFPDPPDYEGGWMRAAVNEVARRSAARSARGT